MKRLSMSMAVYLLLGGSLTGAQPAPPELSTVAEASEFRATAGYADVVELVRRIAAASPVAAADELGRSAEGRSIPLLWLADPPVRQPADVLQGERLVVLLLGGIHGGEICGKEALLMLARDLATGPASGLLEQLAIAVVPVYNVDGADRISPDNRPRQQGPERGTGQRANAQGLDLNRDHVKLEAPETRGLLRFLRRWDPALVVDTHTTNGSHHRNSLTYDGPQNPAGDSRIIEFVRDRLLPAADAHLARETGYASHPYGNFDEHKTTWTTYPDQPRFGTRYRGLRNRLSVLSEAHAYVPFRERVLATRAFVRGCLEFAAAHRSAIRSLLRQVDQDTTEAGRRPGDGNRVAIRSRLAAYPRPIVVQGWVERRSDSGTERTGIPRDYEVEHLGRFEPELEVRRPFAYLLPARAGAVIDNLLRHGIRVQELREDVELELEVFRLDRLSRQAREFQGHHLSTVEVTRRTERAAVPAGTLLVPTAQPLGSLAVYLLEPESADGLTVWNFFDPWLEEGSDLPVRRVPNSAPLIVRDLLPLPEDRPRTRPVSFEALFGPERVDFGGPAVRGLRWLPDGTQLLQRRDDAWYRVEAESGRAVRLADEPAMVAAADEVESLGGEAVLAALRRPTLHADPRFRGLLIETAGDLFYVAFDGGRAIRLTRSPAAEEELPRFSPDGRHVAFVREHDLWVVNLRTGRERRLTHGGSERRRRGKATWVYFEELFGRDWTAFWWSPDSRRIAFMEFDDSAVPRFELVDDIPPGQAKQVAAYPKPGQPNPRVRLGVVAVNGANRPGWADLSRYAPEDLLLCGVHWWPGGETVLVLAQDRRQRWLDVLAWRVRDDRPRHLLRDETEAWVSGAVTPRFLDDGSFLMTSERSGWRHLYHFGRDGRLRRQITSGDWEVRQVRHVEADAGWVYFTGTRDSHLAENLYRARLDGSRIERLTRDGGHHRVQFSPRGGRFLDHRSAIDSPPSVVLRDRHGRRVRVVDSNPVRALEEYDVRFHELLQIPTADGPPIEAALLKPRDFDPGRRYPVWFTTYGGPQAPTVRDRWSSGFGWDQLLAAEGFVVLRADPRSASGKGARSAWRAFRRLGVAELEDIRRAVEWLRSQPWVDPRRIGMSGGSYGGYLTSYAMTHTELFAAGVAVAPVTDWRDYDSIYTERYMSTPQDNPEGYEASSVIRAADQLHGRLLLVHGTLDDNVHPQNTIRLVRELQQAGKIFELMLYPQARHRIPGPHLRRTMLDFMKRALADAEGARDFGG